MTDYAVMARTQNGWVVINWFDSPAKADKWLMDHIRKNGYSVEDFTIKAVR